MYPTQVPNKRMKLIELIVLFLLIGCSSVQDYETMHSEDYQSYEENDILTLNDPTDFTVESGGNSLIDSIFEDETRTYTINGMDFEVTVEEISRLTARFSVNGMSTLELGEGDMHELFDGSYIGVVEITETSSESIVQFILVVE